MPHDKITADGKKFFAEIEKLKKLQLRIGYQRGLAEQDGIDIADVAAWNELGTSKIPARPFLRSSVDDNAGAINKMCQAQIQNLKNGATAEEILNNLGVMQKGFVQKKISDGSFTPNAVSTIKRKKSSKPLVDTGLLRQSVNFVITEKGGVED